MDAADGADTPALPPPPSIPLSFLPFPPVWPKPAESWLWAQPLYCMQGTAASTRAFCLVRTVEYCPSCTWRSPATESDQQKLAACRASSSQAAARDCWGWFESSWATAGSTLRLTVGVASPPTWSSHTCTHLHVRVHLKAWCRTSKDPAYKTGGDARAHEGYTHTHTHVS